MFTFAATKEMYEINKVRRKRRKKTNETDKKTAFTTAWKELGFEKEERTSHEMFELFDEWEATGYKQSAADFLAKHK